MKRLILRESDLAVLFMLLEEPAHGYQLLRRCPELKRSQAYNSLAKLRRRGFLQCSEETQLKAPSRVIYGVLPSQRRHVQKLLEQSVRSVQAEAGEYLKNYRSGLTQINWLGEIRVTLARASDTQYHEPS